MLKLLQTHSRERASERVREQELCLSPCEPCTVPCTVCVQVNVLSVFTFLYTRINLHVSVVFKACYHGVKQSKSVAD